MDILDLLSWSKNEIVVKYQYEFLSGYLYDI